MRVLSNSGKLMCLLVQEMVTGDQEVQRSASFKNAPGALVGGATCWHCGTVSCMFELAVGLCSP